MSNRNRPTAPRPKHRRAFRPGTDMLEGRQLMTAIPYAPIVDLSNQNWQNVQVPTTPMVSTPVRGVMPPFIDGGQTNYGDRFQFYLNKGEIADVSVLAITLYQNSSGQGGMSQGNINASSESIYAMSNGVATYSLGGTNSSGMSDYVVDAPASGWYQVSVHTPGLLASNISGWSPYEAEYVAYVRPIALDSTPDSALNPNANPGDVQKLDFANGGMYAFLNGRTSVANSGLVGNTGTSLTYSGPTGRGFTIDGNWTESLNPSSGTITYKGTSLVLEVPDPSNPGLNRLIPLSNSQTGMTITAQQATSNDAQGLYGLVTAEPTINFGPASIASQGGLIQSIGSQFGVDMSSYGISSSTPGINWGIDLGKTASGNTNNVPMNAAVPYLWFNFNVGSGGSVTMGGTTASVGTNLSFSAAVDPEDPAFYLDVAGAPVVTDVGVGLSVNDLIPYYATTQWADAATHPFFGDLYYQGGLDLAPLTGDTVPIQLSGNLTLNLDPHHYGAIHIINNVKNDIKNLLTGHISTNGIQQVENDAQNAQIGVNGQVALGIAAGPVNITVPLAGGSAEWDGVNHFDFAAATINPLAQSPVSFLTSASGMQLNGEFNTSAGGQFDVNVIGKWGMLGQTLANGHLEVSRNVPSGPIGVTVTGSTGVNASIGVTGFGASVGINEQVTVTMDSSGNGTLAVNGSAVASGSFFGFSGQSDTEGYNKSYSGNIAALITQQYNDARTAAINGATAYYIAFVNDVQTGFKIASNAIKHWFS